MRGIQYAAASRIHHCVPVVIASEAKQSIVAHKERLDCFASLAMTALMAKHTFAISRHELPEVCIFVRPLENRATGL
jgi:hypothetical protein